jgi:hypothetical protein
LFAQRPVAKHDALPASESFVEFRRGGAATRTGVANGRD